MSLTPLVVIAAEPSHSESGVNPWLVGGALLVLFLLMIGGLLAFGAGRDHS